MRCPNPNCRKPTARQTVKESQPAPNGTTVRTRMCPACKFRYSTVETLQHVGLSVQKNNGSIVAFDEKSLFRSIDEATADWHSDAQIRDVIAAVKRDLYPGALTRPVESREIGRLVLRHLKKYNVSHIRFALVFAGRLDRAGEGFKHARDVRRWLREEYPKLEDSRSAARLSEVVKPKTGLRERFEREKLKRALRIAFKGRGPHQETERHVSDVADEVIRALGEQSLVTSGQIAAEVLRALRPVDDIAYLRYASTIKNFATVYDYEAEARALQNERREATKAFS